MKIVAIIVTLVCCGLMFYVKREWKAAMLVMGAMTLTPVDIPAIPLHKANLLLQVAFLLSEWRDLPKYFKRLQCTPYLWNPLLIVSFSILLAALTSPYTGIKEMVEYELLFKYFAIGYAFWTVKDEKSLKPILHISLYCLIALTFFGVLNYIDKSAMFVNALTEGKTTTYGDTALGDVYTESSRFRVQSMFMHPFDYGYICAAMLLLHLHGRNRRLERKRDFIIAIACCSFGILTCGSRTVWVSAVFSIACYSMWTFPLGRNAVYGIVAMMLMVLSYLTVPAIEEKVNQVTDVFVEDSETEGSSIQMRMSQFMYVLIYTEGNEWLGLGKGFWEYKYTEDPESIRDLLGVESVILQTLLERGIIGLVLWAAFYTAIFLYFWRNRQWSRKLTGLGVAVLSLYIFFSIGTGELGSVYPTMLLLGMVISICSTIPHKIAVRKVISSLSPEQENVLLHTDTASAAGAAVAKSGFTNPLPKENSGKRLAIIIPAYKATFLPATLDSIAAQTCKDFTLYVGDDHSPEPIGSIVEQYKNKIDIVYKRFGTNLGGTDLVAQWERCIAMSREEPYIWLFSDDDVMESNCVEELLWHKDATSRAYNVYHFDVDRIDGSGAFVSRKQDYPAVLSSYRFYRGKNSGRLSAFVVENVFSRKAYEQYGFPKYDLAWGSDVAAWIVFSSRKGMCTVPNARVCWRESSQNITPDYSRQIAERKLKAQMALLNWANLYFAEEPDIYTTNRAFFILFIHYYREYVSKESIKEAFDTFFAEHGRHRDWPLIYLFAFLNDGIYFRIRKRFTWLYGDIKDQDK